MLGETVDEQPAAGVFLADDILAVDGFGALGQFDFNIMLVIHACIIRSFF